MMKKLLSGALLLATAGATICNEAVEVDTEKEKVVVAEAVVETVVANNDNNVRSNESVENNVNDGVQFNVDLGVQIVKEDGSVVNEAVKFTRSGTQHEIDSMIFEVVAKPDNEAGYAALDLKIYRKTMQDDVILLCAGEGKVALNKEEMVQITERTNDDEVVQTMTLTILVTE